MLEILGPFLVGSMRISDGQPLSPLSSSHGRSAVSQLGLNELLET